MSEFINGSADIRGSITPETDVVGAVASEEQISGIVTAGPIVLNDYVLTVVRIIGGHQLVIRRGTEIQTLDIMDGRDSFAAVVDDGNGNVSFN